jgi:hypothetical protein
VTGPRLFAKAEKEIHWSRVSPGNRGIPVTARDDNSAQRPIRRLRIDDFASPRPVVDPIDAPTRSGRRVVIAAGLAFAVFWGALYLAFRDWRVRYRERAAFGASQVAPAIDPLAETVPSGINRARWRQAVADTHAALVTLTASNLLDRAQMNSLRGEIAGRVARAQAHPDRALDELAGLWNDLADRAEPVLAERHPRPKLLPPRPQKDPRTKRLR